MNVSKAADILRDGGVIAYATEAVFGLGCDPQNQAAIKKLLELKQRPVDKGLILIAGDEVQLHPYLDLPSIDAVVWQRVRASWPGPVTWLLPAAPGIPSLLRGDHATLAVRVSAHPQVAALCRSFGGALVSTSANLSGHAPARSASEVSEQFNDLLDAILPGETGGAEKPSEIRDARTGRILRSG